MTTHRQDEAFRNEMVASDFLERAIQWIGGNLLPGDVFAKSELEEWAEENGYVRGEEYR